MDLRSIPVEEALGHALAHDLTKIDTEKGIKGARFRRGHILQPEDLPVLREMGRRNLSIIALEPDEVHEDEAALSLAKALAGEGFEISGPEEGRCRLVSTGRGIVNFDPEAVRRINRDREWSFACTHINSVVGPGSVVAAFRILPLCLKRDSLERAVEEASPFSLIPFIHRRVGLVSTGQEILEGLVKDSFREKLERKLWELGGSFSGHEICGDRPADIVNAIDELLGMGSDIVVCTGGMSIDADDRTPQAIETASDEVLFRGVPMIPGSNLMLAMKGLSWIIGAPACVAHDERTALDRLLIALFAGLGGEINVSLWGEGGLCRRCRTCIFPECEFARIPS
ncbi:MAG: molybdopterin-binding protein [Thermovirgaceae bacterium]|nr:molybdopterin-binding protein [Synergistales bacterium]MDI9393569.1 molybdopterin-binding protein [Synergistota bacterium]MDY0179496.1 molybdopterin-binding protein [Synergistaceae bacterium]HRW87033.1 molybdopterin-binding protein [Thermovirgaceae bacterium]MDD3133902.1 molybdopterin-binding protein [Synergistales bacterium]